MPRPAEARNGWVVARLRASGVAERSQVVRGPWLLIFGGKGYSFEEWRCN